MISWRYYVVFLDSEVLVVIYSGGFTGSSCVGFQRVSSRVFIQSWLFRLPRYWLFGDLADGFWGCK